MDFIYLLLAQMLFSLALLRMQSVSAVLFIHVYFSDVKFLSLLQISSLIPLLNITLIFVNNLPQEFMLILQQDLLSFSMVWSKKSRILESVSFCAYTEFLIHFTKVSSVNE